MVKLELLRDFSQEMKNMYFAGLQIAHGACVCMCVLVCLPPGVHMWLNQKGSAFLWSDSNNFSVTRWKVGCLFWKYAVCLFKINLWFECERYWLMYTKVSFYQNVLSNFENIRNCILFCTICIPIDVAVNGWRLGNHQKPKCRIELRNCN